MNSPVIQLTDATIFAADDDPDDLALLQLLLRKAGVDVPLSLYREGEDIVAALSRLASGSLDAVRPLLCFLDVKMATQTGLEVLRWLRAQTRFAQLPVVFISGSNHPRDVREAVESGAQCYLTKYPQPAVLRDVIEDAWRMQAGVPAEDCFRLPTNELLIRARRL